MTESFNKGQERKDTQGSVDIASAAQELRTLIGRLTRKMKAASAVSDIIEVTSSQFLVMSRLDRQGPNTPASLARAEMVRPQSMALTLNALEERHLISRSPHPTDGRQVVMSLTEMGKCMLNDDRNLQNRWLEYAIAEKFTSDEQKKLINLIDLLKRLIQE